MGRKLYVGNLSYNVDSSSLQEMFAPHGTVESAEIIADRETGRSKGFGFVQMGSDQEAATAISAMNGQTYDGRPLTVNEAKPREDRPPLRRWRWRRLWWRRWRRPQQWRWWRLRRWRRRPQQWRWWRRLRRWWRRRWPSVLIAARRYDNGTQADGTPGNRGPVCVCARAGRRVDSLRVSPLGTRTK